MEKIKFKKSVLTIALGIVFLTILMSHISYISAANQEEITIDFFWMSGCPACAQMKSFFDELEKNYDFKLNSYETSRYSNLFLEKLEEYNVPNARRGYVPTTFIQDKYFVGYSTEIGETIELILQGHEVEDTETLIGETIKTKVLGIWDVEVSLTEKSLWSAGFILALLDSINVCSITVLIFLIIYSLSIGSIKRAFKVGIIFTIVIFIFYALFMLLLTTILGVFVNVYGFYIRIIVSSISLFAGLLLIKDFFWYGKGISLGVPSSAKPILEKYIKQATIGSTIILAVLASLVELPCTAIFPLVYTTILAGAGVTSMEAIPYILFYNLIYVWPLLFVVFGTYFSWTKIKDVDQKIQKAKKWMRLIAGIALLLISLYFAWPLIMG